MIHGIGTDLVKIQRFATWLDNPGLQERYFSSGEISFCRSQGVGAAASLAARFAAKEAFGKAMGLGLAGMSLKDIEVERGSRGEPILHLGESAKRLVRGLGTGTSRVHISLSHEGEYALAFVVVEYFPDLPGRQKGDHDGEFE